MARSSEALVAFNRGIVSSLGLVRVFDIERLRMAASRMVNWMPRVLGSMMLRPGTQYIGGTKDNDQARGIPFVFSANDQARIEFTDSLMRVWVNDVVITRPSVSAAVTNGFFTASLSSWVDKDESGATSQHRTGGYLELKGTGTNAAARSQPVSVTETGTEHALRIIVDMGDVGLRIGSTDGGDEYFAETFLGSGEHSIAFTPTGGIFYVYFFNREDYPVTVDSCKIESGDMELTAPYATADLRNIRHAPSGDVIELACDGVAQYKIERRSTRSWSLVKYRPKNGPFRIQNVTALTLTPGALDGETTLVASKPLFQDGHLGALFRLESVGQTVSDNIATEDTFTDPIMVTGTGQARVFGIVISGTFSATVTVQYSVGAPGNWIDLATTYTGATSTTYDDDQDNQVIYYRIGVKTGDYTSGTVVASLNYSGGGIQGVCEIIEVTDSTNANIRVLQHFGSTDAQSDWWEGEWSDYRGYPSAVAFFDGRLWWMGRDKWYGSVSDGFEDWDDNTEGDSGPINRSIGEGPVDSIHWALPLARLIAGTALNSANVQPVKMDGNHALVARSTSFDEPLTPTNFHLKNSAARGAFVDRSGQRVFELVFDAAVNDYEPDELTLLCPELNSSGIVHMAVQMKPDIRIHCIRSDGTVGILVYDRVENVIAWCEKETDGVVEDILVLPGTDEDSVYECVQRTIDGNTVRYWEKWAKESECTGFPTAKHQDCHYVYSGSAVTTISGLDHLEGESVSVWGWNTTTPFTNDDGDTIGKDLGTFTVSSGAISGLGASVTDAVIGLDQVAEFKGMKLKTISQNKKISGLGLVLKNTHYQGLRFGNSLTNADMHDLSKREDFKSTGDDHIYAEKETTLSAVAGEWSTDERLCLRAASPRPCTVLGAVAILEH